MQRIETGLTLAAEQDSQLIATASLNGQEITAVFVDPDRQRFGFGQLLMQDLEERARKSGIGETVLSVSRPSKKFYEGLGYQIVEKRCKDWAMANRSYSGSPRRLWALRLEFDLGTHWHVTPSRLACQSSSSASPASPADA